MTYRYRGGGGFVPGVPARDLTDEEAAGYGVESSPAYVFERDEPEDVAAEEPAAEEPVTTERRRKRATSSTEDDGNG